VSDFGFVLALGGVLAAGFVYVWRRERSRAAVLWAASWIALYSAGLLVTQPGRTDASLVLSILLGQTFAVLLLAGALAFSGRLVPRWLLPLGVAGAAARLAAFLWFPPTARFAVIVGIEAPLIVAAAVLVARAARRRSGTFPERLLGPAIGAVALVDVVDAFARTSSDHPNVLVVPWLATMLAVALLQLISLVERSLGRERRLMAELEQARKLETLGRLAGGVAHDFNNQLMAILGNAELLRDHVQSDAVAAESLRDLEDAARICAELTEELLAFARRSRTEPRAVDVAQVLRDVERWLHATLPDGVAVCVGVEADLRPVLADPIQLKRALTNLAANARDALDGHGVISLEASSLPAVDLDSAPPGADGFVEIRVRDTGTGMDDATRERIFDPFFTTKPFGKGSGLGLAVVYGTVTGHGGAIEVESAPGAGTTFRMRWPAAARTAPSAVQAPLAAASGSETVLLAEDEPAVRAIARKALESAGFVVIEATDGHDALELFERHRREIDVALVDLAMPGRDGRSVVEAMRREAPDLPMLLMSGHIAREAGLDLPPGVVVLPKPFGIAQLTRAVRRAIDEARPGGSPPRPAPAALMEPSPRPAPRAARA